MNSTVIVDRVLNIAHRGARSLAPENTLSAARKGLEVGADMWELDVQLTADGELIVIHDSTLKRTSNAEDVFPYRRPWQVHEFTLDEIRKLDFGSWFMEQDPFGQIAAGVVTDKDLQSYMGEPAPTLEQALLLTRQHNWSVNVEIKDLRNKPGNNLIVDQVIALVEKLDMVDMVLVSSFNHKYLAQSAASYPHVVTGVLDTKPHGRPASLLRRLGARTYHPRKIFIRPADIPRLKRQGFRVYIRTINDRKTMERLARAGVDGIFTDFPQVLASIVTSYGRAKA
ncbi:MAG: glycerophosphodiester phosphodiesterase [Deltaproteobacteria bacterium]|nr:glycerophosphodiester phosphodiesterase [Deltaproteobacteria bacterium]